MSLSTHVLDASRGTPATGVAVRLTTTGGQELATAVTDADGRVRELAAELAAGTYRITFDTGAYFADTGQQGFYPEVAVTFTVTDADGRVRELAAELAAGDYRLTFATGEYFAANGQQGFYPEVVVTFTVTDPEQHHHVPLLLSPYAYSTYRGS